MLFALLELQDLNTQPKGGLITQACYISSVLQAVPECVPGGGSGHVHYRHPRGDDAPRHQEEVRGQLQEREGENIHRGEQYSNTYTV